MAVRVPSAARNGKAKLDKSLKIKWNFRDFLFSEKVKNYYLHGGEYIGQT